MLDWQINLIVTIFVLFLAFAVVVIMDFLIKKGVLSPDVTRKVIHIIAGSWVFFWILYRDSDWTRYLNVTLPVVFGSILVVKGLGGDPNDMNVRTMSRSGDRTELLRGPLYFTIMMIVAGTVFYKTEYALVTMAVLGWGDGIAPLVAKIGQVGKYRTFGNVKSISGSVSLFLVAVGGAVLMLTTILGSFGGVDDWLMVLISALVATIVEAFSPRDLDNVFIPLSLLPVWYLVPRLL